MTACSDDDSDDSDDSGLDASERDLEGILELSSPSETGGRRGGSGNNLCALSV